MATPVRLSAALAFLLYAGTSVGACVARRLVSAAAPRSGGPITLQIRFSL